MDELATSSSSITATAISLYAKLKCELAVSSSAIEKNDIQIDVDNEDQIEDDNSREGCDLAADDTWRDAVYELKFKKYSHAVSEMIDKPALKLKGTSFYFMYDVVNGFYLCDIKGNLIRHVCPMQPCKKKLTLVGGCPKHNDIVTVKVAKHFEEIRVGKQGRKKLFRNMVVREVDIKYVKEIIASDRNTGSDYRALLKSVGNLQYRSEECGILVSRRDHHSNSLTVKVIGIPFQFDTCGGPDCNREGIGVKWMESFCGPACEQKRMKKVEIAKTPFGDSSPASELNRYLRKRMNSDMEKYGSDVARQMMYDRLFGAGDAGFQIFCPNGYRFLLKLTVEGKLTYTWYGNNNHPEKHCHNVDCLRCLRKRIGTGEEVTCNQCNGFDVKRFLGHVEFGCDADRDIF